MKPNKSFRIDPDLLSEADKIGLPVVQIFEAALAKALKSKRCPYCGSKLKFTGWSSKNGNRFR